MTALKAANAFAIVVGVENTSVFADDPLLGPVLDAKLWCEKLERWGVPPERIQLFVSAKPTSQQELDLLAGRGGCLPLLPPTEEKFRRFVLEELPTKAVAGEGAALIIVWSGHGVINQRDAPRTRRLYYSDSSPVTALNLELVSFMQALRTTDFAGFSQQVMIVDACANYMVGFSKGGRMLAPTDFSRGPSATDIQQRVLLAAAPGHITMSGGAVVLESAHNFSRQMLQAAAPAGPGLLPDFGAAYRVVRQLAMSNGKVLADWCDAVPDDVLPDAPSSLLRDQDTTSLLAALSAVGDPALLRQAYQAALHGIETAATHQDAAGGDTQAMALVLAEAASTPGDPPAPVRWAAQVAVRLPMQDLELELWLRRWPDPLNLLPDYRRRALVEFQAGQARGRVCHLLVVENPDAEAAGTSRLVGWVFVGDPPLAYELGDGVALPADAVGGAADRAAAMKALVDDALVKAQDQGIAEPDLIIEVALPHEEVDEDVEGRPIGLAGRERPLGQRYPVVRRCADRLLALSRNRGLAAEILLWKKTAQTLAERFDDHGLRIVWISDADIRGGKLDMHLAREPRGSCVGLQRDIPSRLLATDLKHAVFDDGLPFACWNDEAWADGDTEQLHAALAAARGAKALFELWEKSKTGFAASRLRLLWDDPRHNPYDKKYKVTQR